MERYFQTPRNLTASGLRSSASVTEVPRQGAKHFLRRRKTSLSDMGDTRGVYFFFFASTHRGHSYCSISPGRFFAVNEVKALLAHIVVTYDIRFEEGKQAPRSLHVGTMRIPGKADAMFRKRQR